MRSQEAKEIGQEGEHKIYQMLSKYKDTTVIKNIYIRDKRTKVLTEIDMIMVHSTGIYVIESKNYAGYICYDTTDKWCQVYKNGMRRLFYSPVKQNIGHIKKLIKHFGWERYGTLPIYSYVVFGEKATIRPYITPKLKVIQYNQLQKYISRDLSRNRVVLHKELCKDIIKDLTKQSKVSIKTKEEHLRYVKKVSMNNR